MTPYLDCNIWSIAPYKVPYGYFIVEKVYRYNSLNGDYNFPITSGCIQIPEFEIRNFENLYKMDIRIIQENAIPIVKQDIVDNKEVWSIGTLFYDNYIKLQSRNSL